MRLRIFVPGGEEETVAVCWAWRSVGSASSSYRGSRTTKAPVVVLAAGGLAYTAGALA